MDFFVSLLFFLVAVVLGIAACLASVGVVMARLRPAQETSPGESPDSSESPFSEATPREGEVLSSPLTLPLLPPLPDLPPLPPLPPLPDSPPQPSQPSQPSRPSQSSHPATTPSKTRKRYRTEDGADYFCFSFEKQADGSWRAYILEHPPYGERASDAHTTHRLSDGGRKYVCWSSPLQSLEQAEHVAKAWAEATQGYIRTGARF